MGPWFILPIMVSLNGIVGIWTVYGVAQYYSLHNATGRFPYISECGDQPPASCIFSQVCNNSCILALIFELLRFRSNKCSHENKRHLNNLSFAFGVISSLAFSVTGNFQSSPAPAVHVLSAILAFISGLVYFWVQLWLIRIRVQLIVALCFCIVCTVLCFSMFGFSFADCHSVAATLEWIMVTSFFLQYPVFVFDFTDMKCSLTVRKGADVTGDGRDVSSTDSFLQPHSSPAPRSS